MEQLRIFHSLHLDKLAASWVDSIWDRQFLFVEPLPEDYLLVIESDDTDLESLLRNIIKVLKKWIHDNETLAADEVPQEAELSWQTLITLDIDSRPLLALLGYLIKIGQDREHDQDAQHSCLLSTSLYLYLLEIPGSLVYQVFHENLFQLALDTFKFAEGLVSPVKKSRVSHDLEDFCEDDETQGLSTSQKKHLTESLNTIMWNLVVFLGKFSLRDIPRSLEATITALISVTKLVTENHNFQSPKRQLPPSASLGTLNHNAYAALTAVCQPRHGEISITIKLIIKNILTFMTQNNYNDLNAKLLASVRKNTIHFLHTLANDHQEAVEDGIIILIHKIMINHSKSAPDRQKEVLMIMELLKNLKTRRSKDRIGRDFLRFSHQNKIGYRIFAQEIIKSVLDVSDDLGSLEGRNLRMILLSTVLCHCNDVSSLVRAKCLSTISKYTENPDNLFVDELFVSRDKNVDLPSVDDLEEAVNNLSENLDILPDVVSMISMLEDRVEDERAAVRISAIQTLRNCVMINQENLEIIIGIISRRCRDATMTVRICAIKVMTSLFESFPGHMTFCSMWVKSVVPQVFDVEIDVQGEALRALQALTINPISNSRIIQELPWKVLKELSRNKMRKHLAKACIACTENGSLTNEMITKIQSQIDSEHNIEAWMLLSAISEARVVPRMQVHFNDYDNFLEADHFVEPIFEVLRSCWSTFHEDFLEKMNEVFMTRLHDFQINERLVSISLDIVHQVSEFLDSRGKNIRCFEDSMTDLIQESETVISSMLDSQTSEILCRRAIYTLGHASLLCTKEPALPVVRILQGFLIDHEMIPTWVKDTKRLQACAIVALGQQSMRNETIAHEMMTIFAQLLSSRSSENADEDAAVRVNAAKALADVATRFTSLVEPHLPDMCVSMKDSNPIVREAIVVIFIQLLVEDYIKVKGNFFFHILTMLADEENTIREMTIFLIKERLLMKNKDLISQQFLEAIFHYNDFDIKNKFCKRKMKDYEKAALALKGGENEPKRRVIYDFMLEHLELPGKEKLNRLLMTQVLNGFISGNFKIKAEGFWVLRDVLYVISSDHLQVGGGGKVQGDDEEETEGGKVSNSTNALMEKVKKHRLSILLPALGELRRKLKGSKIEGEIGRAFVKISGEFGKDQLAALFAEYPAVEAEMEYNVRLFGRKADAEEEVEDASQPIEEETSADVTQTAVGHRTPKIVLRRLSSLTYPELNSSTNSIGMSYKLHSNPVVILNNCTRDLNLVETPKSSKHDGRVGKGQLE